MSYNIIAWHVLRLDDFELPINALEENEELDCDISKNTCTLWDGATTGTYIKGRDVITISVFRGFFDDGSGFYFHNTFLPMLKDSDGILDAVIVWEDGELSRLIVQNGAYTYSDLEISAVIDNT